jgi:hypothetical protein
MDVELVILVGLQASGKSTFFHEQFAATHEHVSKDLLRNNRNRNRRQRDLIEAALQAGRPVVVDNTNPAVEDRRPLVGLGASPGPGSWGTTSNRGCASASRATPAASARRGSPTWPYTRRPRDSCPPPARRVSTSFSVCG